MHEKRFFSLLFPQFSPNSIPYGGQRRAKVSFSFLEKKVCWSPETMSQFSGIAARSDVKLENKRADFNLKS